MKKLGLYLESGPACGGSYQYNRHLLKALTEIALQKRFELVAFVAAEHWHELLKPYHIRTVTVCHPKWTKVAQGIWRRSKLPLRLWHCFAKRFHPLAKQLIDEDCDFVIFPAQDALTYLMPVPSIGVIHDLMHRFEPQFEEVASPCEFSKREFHYQLLATQSKAILVDSPLGKEHAESCYPVAKGKCHVLPFISGISSDQVTDIRAKYQLPAKFFFYPAQFWEHKNHQTLLYALQQSLITHPDMQLVLVGSPKNAYQKVKQLIAQLKLDKHVNIVGLVPDEDMAGFYQHARALVMPTFFGPTNIPPLEAFALGCPVAVSGIYAMPKIYQDAALYFDPNSVEQLHQTLNQLWSDDVLCEQLIKKGYRIHKNWQFPQFQTALDDILSRCVNVQ